MENTEEKLSDSPNHKVLDLREDVINRTIVRLALPSITENLLGIAVLFSDTIIVGWLKDANALAGVLLGGSLIWFITSPFQALAVATNSLVARNWGAREFESAKKYARQSLSFTLSFSFAIVIIGLVLAEKMIQWMGGESHVVILGGMYLRIVLLSSIFSIPMMVSNGIIRATGDTKTPMYITLIVNIINIVFSILLAFGIGPFPEMRLAGVAWGTTIAQSIGGILSLSVLTRAKTSLHIKIKELFYWNKEFFKKTFFLAFPVMLERFFNSLAQVLFLRIVAILGTIQLAAHNIALRVESLAFMPALGLSVAMSTIVGQALGAKSPKIAELAVRRALIGACIFTGSLSLLFALFANQIVIIFGPTPDVLVWATRALRISALEIPFLALVMILSGSLRGAGDTKSPLYVMLICIPVFRFAILYFLAITLKWELSGVWFATALDWAGRSAGLWWIFQRGVWKKIHERQMAISHL